MEEENKELKSRVIKLENRMLESNIIMHGIHEDKWELEENLKEKVYHAISSTVDDFKYSKRIKTARCISIRSIKCLGKYKDGRARPVSVCFEKKAHADILLENRTYLPRGIFVDREYSNEFEENRWLLKPILRLARSIPDYQGKCKLVEDTLIIQGIRYNVNMLHLLPAELSGFNASSRSSLNTLGFFGELNPLSNFHPCQFSVEDTEYHSLEQFIQCEKAKFFGDRNMSSKILLAKTVLECKKLGHDIHGYDHQKWSSAAKERILPGLMSKFSSNSNLTGLLLSTGSKTLVECCANTLWGTGVPLNDRNCLKEKYWKSIGLQGECLMEVRNELRKLEETSEKMVGAMETIT